MIQFKHGSQENVKMRWEEMLAGKHTPEYSLILANHYAQEIPKAITEVEYYLKSITDLTMNSYTQFQLFLNSIGYWITCGLALETIDVLAHKMLSAEHYARYLAETTVATEGGLEILL